MKVTCDRRSIEERVLIPTALRCEELIKNIDSNNNREQFNNLNCVSILKQWEEADFPTFTLKYSELSCPVLLPDFKVRNQSEGGDGGC